jgi:hypothetical protein
LCLAIRNYGSPIRYAMHPNMKLYTDTLEPARDSVRRRRSAAAEVRRVL